jgi:hypothetical protein
MQCNLISWFKWNLLAQYQFSFSISRLSLIMCSNAKLKLIAHQLHFMLQEFHKVLVMWMKLLSYSLKYSTSALVP